MILDKLNLTRRRMIMLDTAPRGSMRSPHAQGQEAQSQAAL
jgi:hypothetical protein